MNHSKYLRRSRAASGMAAALTWTIVLSGCGGGSGAPGTTPTSTPSATSNATPSTTATVSATTTATVSATTTATATSTGGPTPVASPTGTAAAVVPVQFRGFYVGGATPGNVASAPFTFRVNVQGQASGQLAVDGASGLKLPLRGTLRVDSAQVNDPNATAFLDLSASGTNSGQAVSYSFTCTLTRRASGVGTGNVSGSGTFVAQAGAQTRRSTLQVTRQSS